MLGHCINCGHLGSRILLNGTVRYYCERMSGQDKRPDDPETLAYAQGTDHSTASPIVVITDIRAMGCVMHKAEPFTSR